MGASPTRDIKRYDVAVLGAGIVGVSIAYHLALRGRKVVVVDEKEPGLGTSFGNAGVIESSTLRPHAFPHDLRKIARVALKRATEANYHVSFLPKVAPWLLDYYRESSEEKLVETARQMRPLFQRSLDDHLFLAARANAVDLFNLQGWMHLYRTESAFGEAASELELAEELKVPYEIVDPKKMRVFEPCLKPNFHRAVLWRSAANVRSPLKLTQAYSAAFKKLGGTIIKATVRARDNFSREYMWRISTDTMDFDAGKVVVALGPWTPDFLRAFGVNVPMAVKRGYHHHFKATNTCMLTRPVVDGEYGFCLSPQEQIRLTTGAEFADRDAPPSPVQMSKIMPLAEELLPLGEPLEDDPWMGCRPCFADSKPIIGSMKAAGYPEIWVACGHGHKGLTLAATTGVIISDLIAGRETHYDMSPFGIERFL